MQYIDGVHIKLDDPGHAAATQVLLGDEKEMSLIVRWPIDIHIDEKGAYATLRVRVKSLDIKGQPVFEARPWSAAE